MPLCGDSGAAGADTRPLARQEPPRGQRAGAFRAVVIEPGGSVRAWVWADTRGELANRVHEAAQGDAHPFAAVCLLKTSYAQYLQ